MRARTSPVVIGVVGLVVLAVLGAGTYVVTSQRVFEDTYRVPAVFADGGGLSSGSEVRVAGVEAGRVTSVAPDFATGRVRVELEIFAGVDLGRDMTAHVEPLTLVGAKAVVIDGPVEEPYLADLPVARRRIPLERTSSTRTLPDVLDTTSQQIEPVDAEALGTMLQRIDAVVEGKGPQVGALVDNVERLASTLNERDEQVASLTNRLDRFTGALADRDDELQRLLVASDEVLQVVEARRDDLAAALGDGNALVAELSDTITETRVELDRILSTVHPVTDIVEDEQDDIDRAFSWLGAAFDYQSRMGFDVRTGENKPYQETILKTIPPSLVDALAEQFPEFGAYLEGRDR